MKAYVCDLCESVIKGKLYDVTLRFQTDKEKEPGLYDVPHEYETCQQCWMRIEREINRIKTLSKAKKK